MSFNISDYIIDDTSIEFLFEPSTPQYTTFTPIIESNNLLLPEVSSNNNLINDESEFHDVLYDLEANPEENSTTDLAVETTAETETAPEAVVGEDITTDPVLYVFSSSGTDEFIVFNPSDDISNDQCDTFSTDMNDVDTNEPTSFFNVHQFDQTQQDTVNFLFGSQVEEPAVVEEDNVIELAATPEFENYLNNSDQELHRTMADINESNQFIGNIEEINNSEPSSEISDTTVDPSALVTTVNFSDLTATTNTATQTETPASFFASVIGENPEFLAQFAKNLKPTKTSAKRIMPIFTQLSFARADSYWKIIGRNPQFQFAVSKEEKVLKYLNGITIDKSLLHRKVVASLLPNYLTVKEFAKYEDVDGWIYEQGEQREPDDQISLRWCGQKQNFYQTFVFRYRVNELGTKIDKQNLCPYCPYTDGMDLNCIFHTVADSSYMHHVCKDHGVYTTGNEMSIPIFGKTSKGYVAVCTQCVTPIRLSVDIKANNLNNCLISYFRHCFIKHKNKRQNRDSGDAQKEAKEFKKHKYNLLMETA
ncbi:hypothetical protein DAPK24_001220 [Pichia kluyveri]|uniref:Transcription regulator Rua1 C-terminal domain-containing protein n=1 Tax=Pichia kluyveri TaxID=36015 RepID=A0AAV5QX19_PICKL|nr:hypothetical protein DAPK24_001220 [Pichia kluyveri]